MWNRFVHNLWISYRLHALSVLFFGSALDMVALNYLYTLMKAKYVMGR